MPLGQVPVLEIDGKQYHQSKAIGRYLARKNNLVGSNDDEAFQIDATIDTIDELRLGRYFTVLRSHMLRHPVLRISYSFQSDDKSVFTSRSLCFTIVIICSPRAASLGKGSRIEGEIEGRVQFQAPFVPRQARGTGEEERWTPGRWKGNHPYFSLRKIFNSP